MFFSMGGLASLVRAQPGHPRTVAIALATIFGGVVSLLAALRDK